MNDLPQILLSMKAERDAMKQKYATMQPHDHARFTAPYLINQLNRQIEELEQRLTAEGAL